MQQYLILVLAVGLPSFIGVALCAYCSYWMRLIDVSEKTGQSTDALFSRRDLQATFFSALGIGCIVFVAAFVIGRRVLRLTDHLELAAASFAAGGFAAFFNRATISIIRSRLPGVVDAAIGKAINNDKEKPGE